MGAFISVAQLATRLLSDGGESNYYFTTSADQINGNSAKVAVYLVSDGMKMHTVGGTTVSTALTADQAWAPRP